MIMKIKHKNPNSIMTMLLTITTIILIAANVLLGVILMRQSRNSMQSLIRARMLDISNTAAYMIDGDVVRDISAEDVGTPKYQETLSLLRSFQDNIELEYIYCIRDEGGRYSFTIDPDNITDPGQFGEEIAYTKALESAAHGISAVDEEPYEDRWGRFYSAYSPIFDSSGNVAGIVGVDFSADWYEERIKSHLMAIVIVTICSTAVGILMAFTVSARIRTRFTELYDEMNSLANDFEDLGRLIQTDTEDSETAPPPESSEGRQDEMSALSAQLRTFRRELRQYLSYVHSQAYTDTMTGVGSKTAYLKKVRHIDKQIGAGSAAFAVAVFDMNGLKKVNDNYGHEMGDRFIIGAASVIKKVFGSSNVYRIGGDEFISIIDSCTERDIEDFFTRLDTVTDEINSASNFPLRLTISKGAAVFSPGSDTACNQVFKRADEAMYNDKCEYYKKAGKKAPDKNGNNGNEDK